jgi:hypothetical protein
MATEKQYSVTQKLTMVKAFIKLQGGEGKSLCSIANSLIGVDPS